MSESTVNIPLLRKAVEWAEAEAAKPIELCEWEQRRFVVPTGRADANVADAHLYGDQFTALWDRSVDCGTCFCIAGYVAHVSTDSPLIYNDIERIAKAELGLTWSQAENLFRAGNDIQQVREAAESIAGERL